MDPATVWGRPIIARRSSGRERSVGLYQLVEVEAERPQQRASLMLEFRIAASRVHSGAIIITSNASAPCTRSRIQSEHRA
jgi:hypothetical protein